MKPAMSNDNYNYFNIFNICSVERAKFIECMKLPIKTEELRNKKSIACNEKLDKFYECMRHISYMHVR
tara:strand:+ start:300 stop:503 length:204 start_codon:yes stop_codon:yes gene_type:complete